MQKQPLTTAYSALNLLRKMDTHLLGDCHCLIIIITIQSSVIFLQPIKLLKILGILEKRRWG